MALRCLHQQRAQQSCVFARACNVRRDTRFCVLLRFEFELIEPI